MLGFLIVNLLLELACVLKSRTVMNKCNEDIQERTKME